MLTAKKALRITRELWTWLARHPDKQKEDWPGWEKYGEMVCGCPLCEYRNEHDLTCIKCLVVNWGHFVCYEKPGLYYKWNVARTPETRSKYAWGIVTLVKEAEERLKKGDN